jgi:serine/threonine protein phosphatase PrpC
MRIEHEGRSHVGRRANNEDAWCAEPGLGLYAVADGMGGYEGGEVASRLAVEAMTEFFRRSSDEDSTWPFKLERGLSLDENRLRAALVVAHREILARREGPLARMGATVVALAASRDAVVIAHAGDSRAYRLRDGVLAQLTRDHSFYEELKAAGADLPPRAQFPHANVVTRALGMDGDLLPELRREPLRAGDVYLLCSDGLTEAMEPDQIRALLALAPGDACDALVHEAWALGGRDNITAVVVRVW